LFSNDLKSDGVAIDFFANRDNPDTMLESTKNFFHNFQGVLASRLGSMRLEENELRQRGKLFLVLTLKFLEGQTSRLEM
jgi:hypothetical protein